MGTEKTGVIYRIYHKGSMKSYIGKSVHPARRIGGHLNGRSSSPVLCNAIKKYGKDAFCVEILEFNVPESWLSKLEILHIRFFNCKAPNGYNLTDGGEGKSGMQVSLETRQKMKGKTPWNKGKTGIYSDETRQAISQTLKGRPSPKKGKKAGKTPWNKGKTGIYSDETLQKMSKASKGRPSPMKGKRHSLESRRKMSEALKGNTPWMKGKTHSSQARQKLSEAHKGKPSPHRGRKHTPESRRKMSEAHKGKIPWNKGKTGLQKHRPETRRKISESLKRRKRST